MIKEIQRGGKRKPIPEEKKVINVSCKIDGVNFKSNSGERAIN